MGSNAGSGIACDCKPVNDESVHVELLVTRHSSHTVIFNPPISSYRLQPPRNGSSWY